MQPHPAQDELLSAYLDGELEEGERRLVEARLESDPAARALLAELRGASAALRSLPRESAPAGIAEAVRARMERESLLGDETARSSAPWLRVHRGLVRFSYAAVVLVTAGVAYLTLVQPAMRSAPAYESAAVRGRAATPMSPAIGGGEAMRSADAGDRALEKAGGELSADQALVAKREMEHGLGQLGYLAERISPAPSRPYGEASDDDVTALSADRGIETPAESTGDLYAMKRPAAGAAAEASQPSAAPKDMGDLVVAREPTAGLVGAGSESHPTETALFTDNATGMKAADSLLAYSVKLSESGAANYSVMSISCDGPAAQQRIADEVSRQTRWLGLTELPFDAAAERDGAVDFAAGVLRDAERLGRPAEGQVFEVCVSGPDSRLAALANNLVQAPAVTNARVEFVAEGQSAADLAESRQLAAEWTRNAALGEAAQRADEVVRLGSVLKPTPATAEPGAELDATEPARDAGGAGAAAAVSPPEDRTRPANKSAAVRRGERAAPADDAGPAIARSATRGGGAAEVDAERDDEDPDEVRKSGEAPARRVERPRAEPPASRAARMQRDADRKAAASQPREEAKPRVGRGFDGVAADPGAALPPAARPATAGEPSAVGRAVAATQATQPAPRKVLLIRIEAASAPTSGPAPREESLQP